MESMLLEYSFIAIGVSMLSLDSVSPIDAIAIFITGFIMIVVGFAYLIYNVYRSQK